jgi:hypothetical protein
MIISVGSSIAIGDLIDIDVMFAVQHNAHSQPPGRSHFLNDDSPANAGPPSHIRGGADDQAAQIAVEMTEVLETVLSFE